ncbi:MAG TPA: ABC transporter ATP-binding protein [Castellaniella sp.]|uniref:ABC transporter ATP-binding protein n=1 Tax=Castellaniella sp. TaxID=1955812 RepID=UPI002EDFCD9A
MSPVLEVKNYSMQFALARRRSLPVLQHIDLAIEAGEVLGLVGESGSGKTTLSWSIMRYLAHNARETSGDILFMQKSLMHLPARELTRLRGGKLGMIFQDPSASLNPTLPLGTQVIEPLMLHRGLDRKQASTLAEQILADVDITNPKALLERYPHQASGGEKQRLLIAVAFACEPACLIFDEPTTALDVISASQVLALFERLRERTGVASLYISHDLALVSKVTDRVLVLEGGRVVETAETRALFSQPQNAYTRHLIESVANPENRLIHHDVRSQEALLQACGVSVQYQKYSLRALLLREPAVRSIVLKPLDLELRKGEILGVVGESGAGKSTLAKALFGLVPFSGHFKVLGKSVHGAAQMDAEYRRFMQLIFQHPDASLNPRQTIEDILMRPLRLYREGSGASLKESVGTLLEQVDLPKDFAQRYPHELSGGQKQRVAIARAFAAQPSIVVCDEITAALDVSVQKKVVELLLDLQRTHGTTYLFITHDLNLIRQIAHRIAVMYRGRLVEILDFADGFKSATHPYTKSLLEAASSPAHSMANSSPGLPTLREEY